MKRSRAVQLILLAAALEGCNTRQCVDETGTVVDPGYCQGTIPPDPSHGYRWYTGGSSIPVGSSIHTATERGIFGSAGEHAHGSGGGEGAGE